MTTEEFLPIYAQAKKDKDNGVYEDFVECMKLYDKQEDGLMPGAELTHILLSLGKTPLLEPKRKTSIEL
jgi:Ca2+-binding EF-hand superfamily protein